MPRYFETVKAGGRAEDIVRTTLETYSSHIYSNVRVETLFTKNGETEIDLIAAIGDCILIVEVKNVCEISGTPSASTWTMTGYETRESYEALNVLTQNRIHVRSFKNAWHAIRGTIPNVASVVVTPNGCVIPEELQACGVLTVQQLAAQVSKLVDVASSSQDYGYTLDFLMSDDNKRLARPDFTEVNRV